MRTGSRRRAGRKHDMHRVRGGRLRRGLRIVGVPELRDGHRVKYDRARRVRPMRTGRGWWGAELLCAVGNTLRATEIQGVRAARRARRPTCSQAECPQCEPGHAAALEARCAAGDYAEGSVRRGARAARQAPRQIRPGKTRATNADRENSPRWWGAWSAPFARSARTLIFRVSELPNACDVSDGLANMRKTTTTTRQSMAASYARVRTTHQTRQSARTNDDGLDRVTLRLLADAQLNDEPHPPMPPPGGVQGRDELEELLRRVTPATFAQLARRVGPRAPASRALGATRASGAWWSRSPSVRAPWSWRASFAGDCAGLR